MTVLDTKVHEPTSPTDPRLGENWSWTILIIRCNTCKGLVELPVDEKVSVTLGRHLQIVHGFPISTIADELKLS